MAPSLRACSFKDNYSSSAESLLDDFYIPALSNALTYDRAAGYFSSALLTLVPAAFAEFFEHGGRLRLLCSPHLTQQDVDLFTHLDSRSVPEPEVEIVTSIRALADGTAMQHDLIRCMSSLLSSGMLEIKFVITNSNAGLFHDKVGVFQDSAGNGVSFIGSANETSAAWSGYQNHEQIESFHTWQGAESRSRFDRHDSQFEEMWQGFRRGLRIVPADRAKDLIQGVCPPEPLAEVLREFRRKHSKRETVPPTRTLRGYQQLALKNWEAEGYRGIISFATGGGKTLTAISAIQKWTASGQPALVLVPSSLLHDQWSHELKVTLGDEVQILKAGAGSSKTAWMDDLRLFTAPDPEFGPRVVVSTYATAISPDFLFRLATGDHLLVVADECHNAGAPSVREMLPDIVAGGRLGLSATAERYNDTAGTEAIHTYFGEVVEPEFGIFDAINSKVLVEYIYRYETCSLADDELQEWERLTNKIQRDMAQNDGTVSDYGFILLQQRARIAKRARAKTLICRDILQKYARPHDRWLIYCSDLSHLRSVRKQLEDLEIPILEYHSVNEASHHQVLDYFNTYGGLLLAIKCLDEGIDIPAVNKAIILSSSTNPREYIQRRGRILRRAPGKTHAELFDVILTDDDSAALMMSELVRAKQFAENSLNKYAVVSVDDLISHTITTRGQESSDVFFESHGSSGSTEE